MNYELITTATGISKAISSFEGVHAVGLDLETTALTSREGKIRLIQLSDGEDKNYIIDVFQLPDPDAIRLLIPFLESEAPRKIIHNSKFELHWTQTVLGCDINGVFDTYIASRIINNLSKGRLDEVLKDYLGVEISKDEQASDWSGTLSESQLQYAITDVTYLPRLRKVMLDRFAQDDLFKIAEIEFGVTRVVSHMEYIGFPIDVPMYEKVIASTTEERDKRHEALQDLLSTGAESVIIQGGLFGEDTLITKRVNVNSWQQLIPAFERIGVTLPKTDKRTIATLLPKHPELQLLTDYKEMETLLKNFGRKNIELINPKTGRLHPTFWQLLTETGRFSSSNPNLQQQPRRAEFRDCFRPTDPERCFLIYDYSGIELRILAQIAQEEVMIDAFNNGKDLHSMTAKAAFNLPCPVEEVKKKYGEQRVLAKGLNFGIIYGMQGKKYADTTGIDIAEANAAVKGFYKLYPAVTNYLYGIEKIGTSARCVYSIAGRKMPLRFDPNNKFETGEAERAARNYPIQSTSADIIKVAMRLIYDDLKLYNNAHIVNTVHDELIVECYREDADQLKFVMESNMLAAAKRFLPDVKVDIEGGVAESWSEK
jgi:DNA polymerase I-like protein with 3'-5' exonuclease and polymerase domains